MVRKDFDVIKVVVDRWYCGKPSRISLYWVYDNSFLCGLGNVDALRLASRILQLQKGKPKVKKVVF